MISYIINTLKLESKKDVDIDSPEATMLHKKIILSKPYLKRLYTEWYNILFKHAKKSPTGKIIEIGSGGGFFKEVHPEIITSDIQQLPGCDMTFPAEKIPFKDNSISAIVMANVLHHIPDCKLFFNEAIRVLCPGGRIVMIEPSGNWWGRFIYDKLHEEPFKPNAGWQIASTGPLSGANVALPWILFKRDIKQFNKSFPSLHLNKFNAHTPFRYLLSGGVSLRALVPSWSFKLTKLLELLFYPFHNWFSMFYTIEIIKK